MDVSLWTRGTQGQDCPWGRDIGWAKCANHRAGQPRAGTRSLWPSWWWLHYIQPPAKMYDTCLLREYAWWRIKAINSAFWLKVGNWHAPPHWVAHVHLGSETHKWCLFISTSDPQLRLGWQVCRPFVSLPDLSSGKQGCPLMWSSPIRHTS